MQKKMLTSVAFAGLLGLGAAIGMTSSASAYTERHCNSDGCWTVDCDSYTGDCRRVWDGDRYYRRHYTSSDYSYDRANGRYIGNTWVPYSDSRRHRVCDGDGDDCHWVYESF